MKQPLLTETQKALILQLVLFGNKTQAEIAQMYNVSRKTIYRALLEQGYKPRDYVRKTEAPVRTYTRSLGTATRLAEAYGQGADKVLQITLAQCNPEKLNGLPTPLVSTPARDQILPSSEDNLETALSQVFEEHALPERTPIQQTLDFETPIDPVEDFMAKLARLIRETFNRFAPGKYP